MDVSCDDQCQDSDWLQMRMDIAQFLGIPMESVEVQPMDTESDSVQISVTICADMNTMQQWMDNFVSSTDLHLTDAVTVMTDPSVVADTAQFGNACPIESNSYVVDTLSNVVSEVTLKTSDASSLLNAAWALVVIVVALFMV